VGSIDLLDPLPAEIFLKLVVHDFRRKYEGDLAQFRKLAFLLLGVEQGRGSALYGPGYAVLGRRINDFDFVGLAKERLRYRLLGSPAADRFDAGLPLPDVLEVNGRDHGDSRGQEFVDILPALPILASGRVLIGETVD